MSNGRCGFQLDFSSYSGIPVQAWGEMRFSALSQASKLIFIDSRGVELKLHIENKTPCTNNVFTREDLQ